VEFGALRLRSFPNPFGSTANIVVDIDRATRVVVQIFDVEGRFVLDLWRGPLSKGGNLFRWQGIDKNGNPLATGVYFVRAEIPNASYTRKIVFLK
jgi:flagellar hook assembly protein FlgD